MAAWGNEIGCNDFTVMTRVLVLYGSKAAFIRSYCNLFPASSWHTLAKATTASFRFFRTLRFSTIFFNGQSTDRL